jgi:hypothetical protein
VSVRRATSPPSPLPAPLREDVIELLATLLLAEVERDPAAYRTGPEGGPTVTRVPRREHNDPLCSQEPA